VYLFQFFGCFAITPGSATIVVLLTALAATVVEALPVTERIDDNISVPITAVVAGSLAMMLTAP
jgi:dolichol kinase